MPANKWEEVEKSLDKIEVWIIQGLSEREIANMLDVSYSTFREYKRVYSALSNILCRAKIKRQEANSKVEQSLYMRATGYNYTEHKEVKCRDVYFDEDGNKCSKEHVVIVELQRHIPGDVAAQKFWLVNKKKQEWKDNPHKVENDKKLIAMKEKEIDRLNDPL